MQSNQGVVLAANNTNNIITAIDSTDKFSRISDSALLDLIQQQTFKYFWDFGHPVSGMARERNTSDDVVTTGGTGFGVMSIIAAVSRNFITRAEGLQRINTIVNFLKNNCTRYHGAFSHWINGATGATVPFSTKDDGGDLVETSFLMEGLLCARQYFNTADANEVSLRANINVLWDGIEWNWFRQGGQNVLYWHWSPTYNFDINAPVRGWNEALVVYALAASSNTDSIPKLFMIMDGLQMEPSVMALLIMECSYHLGLILVAPYFFPIILSWELIHMILQTLMQIILHRTLTRV